MPLLTVTDLARSFADRALLRDVTFSLEANERAALVGRNGTGKTTLLRMIAGLDRPDAGRISLPAWARVAFLSQTPEGPPETTVLDHVLAGAADVQALESRLRALEERMADPAVHDDPGRLGAAMDEYARVREHFEHAGGFTLETRAKTVLTGLGFREADFGRPLGVLSGGWRVRAELARALLGEPDLLLLDEPTNHLDLTATEWLEAYLTSFPGACLIVSHDRYLLDAVTTRTLDLDDGRVESYPGAYSVYIRLREERQRLRREAWERRQEEIARLEDYIRRYRAGQRAAQARSREKWLARVIAAPAEPPRTARTMRASAGAGAASGRMVARLRDVAKSFDGRTVLANVSLEIARGERIGVLGPNGAGKSTLLRIMSGAEAPDRGTVALGAGVRPHYVAQESTQALDLDATVLDQVLGARRLTPEEVRTYLGRFLFSGKDVFKRIGMLSGGERQRLLLATLLLDEPNLLLLDEPTNHLDIASREALEAALQEFPGTMVVATHDRYFLERLAARILVVEDQRVTDFHGTYHDLRQRAGATPGATPISSIGAGPGATAGPAGGAATGPAGGRAVSGRGGRAARAASRRGPRQGAGTAPPTFETIAAEIEAAERERDDATGRLADPELYRDGERARAMRTRYEDAERRLAELYARLEDMETG